MLDPTTTDLLRQFLRKKLSSPQKEKLEKKKSWIKKLFSPSARKWATTLAAIVAAFFAYRAYDTADQTRRGQVKPIIWVSDIEIHAGEPEWYVEVYFKNVGPGPALYVRLTRFRSARIDSVFPSRDKIILAPGDHHNEPLLFRTPVESPVVEYEYSDIYENRFRTTFSDSNKTNRFEEF
jgi:hypothetical protein